MDREEVKAFGQTLGGGLNQGVGGGGEEMWLDTRCWPQPGRAGRSKGMRLDTGWWSQWGKGHGLSPLGLTVSYAPLWGLGFLSCKQGMHVTLLGPPLLTPRVAL